MNPLVSIGVPSYNGARFIAECLESILGQTFEDFEVIIVDDCSTDQTVAIANTYANEHRRISIHVNPSRLGLVGNFNRCVALARGKYVCILGQDDVMLPDNIGLKYQTLENNPGVGFVHSNILRIYDHGKLFAEHWETKSTRDYIQAGRQLLSELLTGQNQICCPSVLVRKDCLDRVGKFDERLFFTCDWEMWMRLCVDYDVACLGQPLIKFRRHSGTETQRVGWTRLELEQELLAKESIALHCKDCLPSIEAVMKEARENLAKRGLRIARKAFYQNDFDNFRRCLFFAIRMRPKVLRYSDCRNLLVRALLGRRLLHAYRSVMSTIAH